MLSAVRRSQAAFQLVCSGSNRAQAVPCECPGRLQADRAGIAVTQAARVLASGAAGARTACVRPSRNLGTGAGGLGALAPRSLCPGCRSPAGLPGAVPSALSKRFSSVLFPADAFAASRRGCSGLVTAERSACSRLGADAPPLASPQNHFSTLPGVKTRFAPVGPQNLSKCNLSGLRAALRGGRPELHPLPS